MFTSCNLVNLYLLNDSKPPRAVLLLGLGLGLLGLGLGMLWSLYPLVPAAVVPSSPPFPLLPPSLLVHFLSTFSPLFASFCRGFIFTRYAVADSCQAFVVDA